MSYDALSRLSQIVQGGATTKFLYDGADIIAEYDGSGALTRRYVHGPGDDEPLVSYDASANRSWLLADERGSIIGAVDASGASQSINTYDEYGLPGALNTGRFQYTGQIWLSEIGLYSYKARLYSPTLGRFLQTDPILYAGGANLYAYVGNDPVNAVDPSGLQGCTVEGYFYYDCVQVNSDPCVRPGVTCVDPGSQIIVGGPGFVGAPGSGEGGGGAVATTESEEIVVNGKRPIRNPLLCSRTGWAGCGADNAEDRAILWANCPPGDIGYAIGIIGPVAIATCVVACPEAAAIASRALGPRGNIIGRKKLGGSSLFNINNNDRLRVGWGWKQSSGRQVVRISGDWLDKLIVKPGSHFDLWPWW